MERRNEQPRRLWNLKDSYDQALFYCKATDDRGHSTYGRLVRMPPSVMEQVASLVESKEFPAYRGVHDFVRDAIVHRLAYLRDNTSNPKLRERLSELLRRVHLEEVTRAYEAEIQFFSDLCERIIKLCDAALAAGDTDTLAHYLYRLREDAEPYRQPFRGKVVEIIERYERKLLGHE